MAEWYLRRGEKVSGPYSKDRVKELAESGKLRPDDELGPAPDGPFREAAEIPGLIPDDLGDDFDEPQPKGGSGKRKKQSSTTQTVVIVLAVVGCVVVLGCGVGMALLLPAVQQAREAARRSQSKNNLKMMAFAIHGHVDAYRTFPPRSEPGQGKHSFMTGLLPFLEQAAIYQQIDLAKDWDAPENQSPLKTEVLFFLNPGVPDEHRKAGSYAAAHYAGNKLIFGGPRPMRIIDFSDGMSNTFVIGEVREGIKPWGDPQNTRDLSMGLGQRSDQFNPGTQTWTFVLADGASKTFAKDVDPKVLKALATPAGGDTIPGSF